MGGATVAIPSSVSAAQINPSGYAMVASSIGIQIISNTVDDGHFQNGENKYSSNQWGLSVNPSPWGFGILHYTPSNEQFSDAKISVEEYRLAVAHTFLDDRLSLGISFGFAEGERQIGSLSYQSSGVDFEIGALYALPKHVMLGASFIPNNTIRAVGGAPSSPELPGFNQSIIAPSQTTLGVAWVPNRFFKAAFSLTYIDPIENVALLADESKIVGAFGVLEPRLGSSYILADFKNLKMECAVGTYFEPARIDGESSRLHATFGLDVNPWIINTGVGFDLAQNYQNVMFTIEVDIIRSAIALKLIPPDPVPHYEGFFPPATVISADGLPDGLTHGEVKHVKPINLEDAEKIILKVPEKIREGLDSN